MQATAAACLSLGLLLTGCASSPSPNPPPAARKPSPEAPRPSIAGVWKVLGVDVGGVHLKAPAAGEAIAIEFSESDIASPRVGGFGGVNRFSGSYSFSLGEMNVGGMWVSNIASTLRAGPEPLMEFESRLLDVLGRARTFSFDGNQGIIDSGGDRIRLSR